MKKIPERLKQKSILAVLTPLEAALVQMIRERSFGEGRFKLANGHPYLLFFEEAKRIDDNYGLNLEGSMLIPPGTEDSIITKLMKFNNNGKEKQ